MGDQPPSSTPPPPPSASPGGPVDKRAAKAQAKADKAYAKASRPWFKKKRIIIPGVLVLLIVFIALGSGDTPTDTPSASQETSSGDEAAEQAPEESALYPDRVDRQREDIEAEVGETVSVGGYAATVTSFEFVQELNDFEDEGYMVVEIEVANDSDRSLPYNTYDWRIQTPNGQVLDPGVHDNVGSGDLVAGGNVSGQVVFDVGSDVSGEYYIIFKPSAWDAARGIWGKAF